MQGSWRTPKEIEEQQGIDVVSYTAARQAEGARLEQIAEELNVKAATLAQFMHRRRRALEQRSTEGGTPRRSGSLKASAVARFGEPLDALLRRWASEERISGCEMAERLGGDPSAVHYWLRKLGLSTSISEGLRRAARAGRHRWRKGEPTRDEAEAQLEAGEPTLVAK